VNGCFWPFPAARKKLYSGAGSDPKRSLDRAVVSITGSFRENVMNKKINVGFVAAVLFIPMISFAQEATSEAPPSTQIPTSKAALNGLALNAGMYAGWVTACDDPATIKHDFMAAADSLGPEDKAVVINNFDNGHSSVSYRTKMALDSFQNPSPRSRGGAIDPCTDEAGNSYREQYEHDLLSVQKLAATESPSVPPTSPAASSPESPETQWSLPPLPSSHARDESKFQNIYEDCLRRGSTPNHEETCQCRMDSTVDYLKKNPTHTLTVGAAQFRFLPCER